MTVAIEPSDRPNRSEAEPTSTGGKIRTELLLALEIGGLCALAFTRPVLDSYGQSPQAFLARDASSIDVLLFALVVAVGPTAILAAAAALTGLGGPKVRNITQAGLVSLLGGVVVWRFGTDLTEWRSLALLPLAVGAVAGTATVRHLVPAATSFLRFLGAAAPVFLVTFLLTSPASDLVLQGSADIADAENTAAVLEGTGGEPPPIVMIVVDAMPTTSLLDGDGAVDGSLYPNLARLVDDATWYRNYSTMSAWTYQAIPTMLTGTLPTDDLPDVGTYPDNLFTLFSGTHDIEAVEQVSRLCPTDVCPRSRESALPQLLRDASRWWWNGADPNREQGQILPGALEPDRGRQFTRWIGEQDFRPAGADGDRPGLWFHHVILPHEPWDLLADGTPYRDHGDNVYGLFLHHGWSEVGAEVAEQRHLLQTIALDSMLGELFDELERTGIYDEAMVVVVGDHGQAYVPGEPLRGVTEAQYEQVMWTPLIVKPPGGREGRIDDTNVQSIDLLPVLADTLGIRLPWETDGVSAAEAAGRPDAGSKQIAASEQHGMTPDDDGRFITVDAEEGFRRVLAARAVDGRGEDAVWRRTPHGGLVGEDLDRLDVVDRSAGGLTVEGLDGIRHPDGDAPRLELVGHTSLELDEIVAVAVNGTVVAVAPTTPPPGFHVQDGEMQLGPAYDDDTVVHALLHPGPFSEDNEVTAYRVTGRPGDATLEPLDVTSG